MTDRAPYRRHTNEFKLQLCRELRSGALGRREAQKKYGLSDNLIQGWLTLYDAQALEGGIDALQAHVEPADNAAVHAVCDERIAGLERKIGQLTMELDRYRQRQFGSTLDTASPRQEKPVPR